jgi:hypothetical protein
VNKFTGIREKNVLPPRVGATAAQQSVAVIHKGPRCGCCDLWVKHLQKNGFVTKVIETDQLDAIKARLGVPDDLASCHTAEIDGYLVEGHVPASAINRLLSDKPKVIGISVPGMPMESRAWSRAASPIFTT